MSEPAGRPRSTPTGPLRRPPGPLGLGEPDVSYLDRHRSVFYLVLLAAGAVAIVATLAYLNYTFLQEPHRILKVIAGGAVAALILARPQWALGLLPLAFVYLIWLPKSPVPLLNGMNLLIASLVYGWIGQALLTHRPIFDRSPWDLPMLAFLAWFFFSWLHPIVLGSAPPEAAVAMLQNLWAAISGLVLFFPVYNNVRTWRQIRTLALLFCVGSALGLPGLLKEVGAIGWRKGVGGGVGQTNVAAAYFAAATMFGIGLLSARYRPLWRQALLVASIVGSTAALIIPASRGAYAAFLAGGITHVLRAGVVWVIVLALVVGAFFVWAPDYVKERVLSAEEAMTAEEGSRIEAINVEGGGRIDFWRAALQVVADNPILGVGYAQSPRVLSQPEYLGEYRPVHNLYLETASEMGIPGLLLLLWLFLAALAASAPLLRYEGFPRALGLAYQSAVIVLIVANFFGGRFYVFNMAGLMSFLSALVFRARRLLEEEEWARLIASSNQAGLNGSAPSSTIAAGV